MTQIKLANPRGFCAGVDRAISIVNRALELFGAPVYVRHEVVHNKFVVDELRERGTVFIENLEEVPDGALLIFSAHGVPKSVQQEAKMRGLKVFDATCPLVTKVHMQVMRHSRDRRKCVLIGHSGHPEVEGTLGQYDSSQGGAIYLVEKPDDVDNLNIRQDEQLAYVTQTTLSVDDSIGIITRLREKFPQIQSPRKDDICYATQNRQDAVRKLAAKCQLVLVVGSANSSNSNRLRELSERRGTPAYLVDGPQEIEKKWLEGVDAVGVTAGASAPDILVQQVINQLQIWGCQHPKELQGTQENIVFALPVELR